jgi:hypothetical protein
MSMVSVEGTAVWDPWIPSFSLDTTNASESNSATTARMSFSASVISLVNVLIRVERDVIDARSPTTPVIIVNGSAIVSYPIFSLSHEAVRVGQNFVVSVERGGLYSLSILTCCCESKSFTTVSALTMP